METYGRPGWARWFPEKGAKSMAVTAALSALIGVATVGLAVYVFRDYGWALFCGVPMAMGVIAPLLHGIGARRTFLQCFAVSVVAQVALLGGMIIFAIEGIFCIAMAAPLWLAFAAVGTCIAYPIHMAMWRAYTREGTRGFPVMGLAIVLAAPMGMGVEHAAHEEPPVFEVTTSIEIDAPAAVVWERIVSFPQMGEPGWKDGGWLFKFGIARPLAAEMEGSGVGATRYCVFSTGKAEEPVRVWEPGRLLVVDVIKTPPSMEETSIYPHLHPAHLEGYLESARARFELIDLGGGRTRVIGTSWYRNRMYPTAYWRWWSDQAIKAVQVRVLGHVKALSEADALKEIDHAVK